MAWTERYVRADAGGTGDGTTDATSGATGAWTVIQAMANATAGHRVNVKAGTYSALAALTAAGVGTTTAPIWWRGYKTTIGDQDSVDPTSHRVAGTDLPSWEVGGNAVSLGSAETTWSSIQILSSRASAACSLGGTSSRMVRCRVICTSGAALQTSGNTSAIFGCYFEAPAAAYCVVETINGRQSLYGCTIRGGSVGIESNQSSHDIIGCSIRTNGVGVRLFGGFQEMTIGNCSIFGCTGDGVKIENLASINLTIMNCIFSQNGGYGINNSTGVNSNHVHRIANSFYLNTSGAENGFGDSPGFFTLTEPAIPFIDTTINPMLRGSSLSIAAGFPGLFEGETYRSYLDRGAVAREMPADDAIAQATWVYANRTLTT